MKIEFSVQEYFNELKLIQEQYAGEEALYPWIFLILQMAENKKREILNEWHERVSIMDVHRVNSQATKEMSKKLREICGAPDIAIIDNDTVIGCVEIKGFQAVSGKSVPEKLFEIQNGTEFPKSRERRLEIKKGKEKWSKWKYQDAKKEHQIMSHLENFKKVIYTNGLKFYFLSLNEKKNKKYIEVKELADLSSAYESFKEYSISQNTILEAVGEWNRLLGGLVAINWHKQTLMKDFTHRITKRDQLEKIDFD